MEFIQYGFVEIEVNEESPADLKSRYSTFMSWPYSKKFGVFTGNGVWLNRGFVDLDTDVNAVDIIITRIPEWSNVEIVIVEAPEPTSWVPILFMY